MSSPSHGRAFARPQFQWLAPQRLRPTEETLPARLAIVCRDILAEGVWREPILVERDSLAIMDGHHRHQFALREGLSRVPCVLVSYDLVTLESRRDDLVVTPEGVIARALSGQPYPPKSTRHSLLVRLPDFVPVALDDLRGLPERCCQPRAPVDAIPSGPWRAIQ
jgi:hypothetical protein